MQYTGKRLLFHSFMIFLFLLSILIVPSEAHPQITNPKEHFGHDIGEDYWLARFLEHGGTILTIGNSTNLAFYLNLPLADALVEKSPEGKESARA